jgi:opacity protein-like surface antigen
MRIYFVALILLFVSGATSGQSSASDRRLSENVAALSNAIVANVPNGSLSVKGQVRSFEVNGVSYPDASLHIPVSFVASELSRFYGFAHYVNRVRTRNTTYGCQPDCSDAEISAEIVLHSSDRNSFTIQPGLQSLTSRNNGTSALSEGYLGFRFSSRINDSLAFSAGGESIIRLSDKVDLGRNAYLGFSKYIDLSSTIANGPMIINLGLGSGAFSIFGNTLISTSYRSDRENTNSDADNFDFGLVGSISISPHENLTLGLEYSGYGVGFGPSFRPIPSIPLVATFYIYDLLWEPDLPFDATPNVFGNLTYRF